MPKVDAHRTPGADHVLKTVIVFAVALLVLRLLGMYTWYFWEEDEYALVTGVAALVKNEIGGGLYRYGPQLGYYRLVEWLAIAGRVSIDLLPYLVKVLSALSSVALPILGLFFARHSLTAAQRWGLAGVLSINPIIWHSARYGNTAMVQMAIAFAGIVLLSNGARGTRALVALSLIGGATLIRADAVLLWPLAAFLLWRTHRDSPAVALRWGVGFTLIMAAVYGVLFSFDPRMDNIGAEVAEHVLNGRFPTLFWEYLIWSFSPIPLMFAVLGARRLLLEDRAFGMVIGVWCLFPFLFYFGSTTTPRYFVLTAVPVSVLTVLGAFELISTLSRVWRPALVRVAVTGALSVHLFVGLGHFTPDSALNPLLGPSFKTHDYFVPTGALLYFTYNPGGEFLKDLVPPSGFGVGHPEHDGFQVLLDDLRKEARPGRTAVVLLNTWFGHGFHYYALDRGAEYESRAPGMYFATETWLRLYGMRIMTIATWSPYYAELDRIPVQPGDLLYVVRDYEFPTPLDDERLPADVKVSPSAPMDLFFQRFDVSRDTVAFR